MFLSCHLKLIATSLCWEKNPNKNSFVSYLAAESPVLLRLTYPTMYLSVAQ